MKDPNRDQIRQRDPRGQQNQDPRHGHKKARKKRRNHCPSHSKSGQRDATSQTSLVPTAGMKEESLIRLVKSFIISHITYIAAYRRWLRHERLRDSRHRGVNRCFEGGNERDKHRSRTSGEVATANTGHTVLSDWRRAVRNFTKGQICRQAERVLRAAKLQDIKVRIKWFPVHAANVSNCNAQRDGTRNGVSANKPRPGD